MSEFKKNSILIIFQIAGLLFLSIALAFLFEEPYRKLVRFLFKFFHRENIQFIGKNIHIGASAIFVVAFVVLISLSFLILKLSPNSQRIKRVFRTIIIFFLSTILISALDGYRFIIECTACDDGIRRMKYSEPNYDMYFVYSLSIAFLYLISSYLLDRNKATSSNKFKDDIHLLDKNL